MVAMITCFMLVNMMIVAYLMYVSIKLVNIKYWRRAVVQYKKILLITESSKIKAVDCFKSSKEKFKYYFNEIVIDSPRVQPEQLQANKPL